MSASLQVAYPISDGTTFDYDYYTSSHTDLVAEHMGRFIDTQVVTKGLAGGPDQPPAFYAIATFTFKDNQALDDAVAAAGPVIDDIANFTNVKPQMLIGKVIA